MALKKKLDFDHFSRLYLHFPDFFQVWTIAGQISRLSQEFKTLYEPYLRNASYNFYHFFQTLSPFSRLFPGLENCWANFKTFSRIQDSVWTLFKASKLYFTAQNVRRNKRQTNLQRLFLVSRGTIYKYHVSFNTLMCSSQWVPSRFVSQRTSSIVGKQISFSLRRLKI